MEDLLKHSVGILVLCLILCCIMRQRRYWRELRENRPSGSLRVAYTVSVATILLTLASAAVLQAEWMREIVPSILLLALVFCVKITFSPSVVAFTLAVCTYRMYQHDEFPIVEVWLSFTRILTWRLPEDVRAAYACVSFFWILISTLAASQPEASAPDAVESLDGVIGETFPA
jgi:hypothetical protein